MTQEAESGEVQIGYLEMILSREGSQALEQAARAVVTALCLQKFKKSLNNALNALNFWWSFVEPGIGINDLCECLPIWDIL